MGRIGDADLEISHVLKRRIAFQPICGARDTVVRYHSSDNLIHGVTLLLKRSKRCEIYGDILPAALYRLAVLIEVVGIRSKPQIDLGVVVCGINIIEAGIAVNEDLHCMVIEKVFRLRKSLVHIAGAVVLKPVEDQRERLLVSENRP